MNTTQQHLIIEDIKDDIVLLKDGGAALVLQTSAVNFGLLSEREQMAIIFSFGQMLNSLSFAIQITIHSARLDITSYLNLLDKASLVQTNPLLSKMIGSYKNFVQSVIKEKQVLDKKFYVVISLSSIELGIGAGNREERFKKIKAMLIPRKDQITKQLSRVGLKANQLTSFQLTKVFYEIYNSTSGNQEESLQIAAVTLAAPQTIRPIAPQIAPQPINSSPQTQQVKPSQYPQQNRNHPFVVEELVDTL